SYLADLTGPDTRKWTPAQTWMILGGLAAALAGVWTALTVLARRTAPEPILSPGAEAGRMTGRSVLLAVAVASGGAAITVMLSGYATGGEIGLPLAAALVGAVGGAVLVRQPFRGSGAL